MKTLVGHCFVANIIQGHILDDATILQVISYLLLISVSAYRPPAGLFHPCPGNTEVKPTFLPKLADKILLQF